MYHILNITGNKTFLKIIFIFDTSYNILKVYFVKFLQTYVLHLISPMYNKTRFSDDPKDDQLVIYKRFNLLSCACELGHSDCVQNALVQFQNWKSTPQPEKNNP